MLRPPTPRIRLSARTPSPHEHIAAVVAAHGALTNAVAEAAGRLNAHDYGQYAAHLDRHRAELNVAIGELGLWLDSFGEWPPVDVGNGIQPPADWLKPGPLDNALEVDLLKARETLKARRANLLTKVANARSALHRAGLPAEEITAYRRVVRLWAGEAIDVVASVHRLTLADRYIRRLARLDADSDDAVRRNGPRLLRQWMHDLEEVDREGEMALAESCGYGEVVRRYRAEAV
jgi:hypothetical protein